MPATPPGEECVVLDATFVVMPGTVTGFALDLGPGRLEVEARLVGPNGPRPVLLTLLGYRGFDPPVRIDVQVGREGWSGGATLAGGVYECNLAVRPPVDEEAVGAPVTEDDTPAELPPFTQRVALRMTLAPE